MSGRTKVLGAFGLFLLMVAGAAAVVAWFSLNGMPPLDATVGPWLQRRVALLLLLVFCLCGVLVHIVFWLDRKLLRPMAQLVKGVEIMANANPLHELALTKDHLLESLPEAVHTLAGSLLRTQRQVRETLLNCDRGMEPLERVIKQLPVGLIVINAQGSIILYNLEAQKIFHHCSDLLGLGRSLYGMLWRFPVEMTIILLAKDIQRQRGGENGLQRFYCPLVGGKGMLDCVMRPLSNCHAGEDRFLITFEEVDYGMVAKHGRLVDVLTSDLIAGLALRMGPNSGLAVVEVGQCLWIQADVSSMVLTLEALVRAVSEHSGNGTIEIQASMEGPSGCVDLIWMGSPIEGEVLESMQKRPLVTMVGVEVTLGDVLTRNGCQINSHGHSQAGRALLRMLVKPSLVQVPSTAAAVPERPEFYDFSLMVAFNSLGRTAGRGLAGLSYVVFDTETTGLHPSKGDEIIAIAGVRIVNGRMLSGETFARLVNPCRPIPAESTRIHGITEADVVGQETIEEVLPQFKSFVGDSVLVAHNAAFDMRFLQMKEARCGIRFDHPVLDTLLLSVYLHSEDTDHTLDAIAKRVGVTIHGRHTAMGDAWVTAEVFLKLLELLNAKGISTLGLAMRASESMVQIRRQQTKARY
ncbi:MAG: 3'-5' exonuclease [Magnetococcales bacterium]|nr:3'-5' exonuclease [Magnetococcales bacterium]